MRSEEPRPSTTKPGQSPIAECKRSGAGERARRAGGGPPPGRPPPRRPPPIGVGPVKPDGTPAIEPEYDADERRYKGTEGEEAPEGGAPVQEDEWGQSTSWQKKGKKKRAKGSRRGVRAKKRSL